MKGLLIKDMQLLKENKNVFIIYILIAIIYMFIQKQDASYFLVSFITMVMGMLVVSTISYDDFNHSNSFLMTLPISRKTYVLEKYALGIMLSLGGCFLSACITSLFFMRGAGKEAWLSWGLFLLLFALMGALIIALEIPVQLKFGSDKGRIAMIASIAGIFLLGFGLKSLGDVMQLDYMAILTTIFSLPTLVIGTLAVVIVLILLALSITISINIMKHKQF